MRVIPIATEVGRETTLCAQRPVRIHTRPHQVRHKDDPRPPAQRCPMNPFRVFPPQPTLFLILQGIGEILAPVLDIWRRQKCRSIQKATQFQTLFPFPRCSLAGLKYPFKFFFTRQSCIYKKDIYIYIFLRIQCFKLRLRNR